MARFRCRACGEEGTFVYDGRRGCPNCGSIDVQLAIGVEELEDDHPLVEAMKRLAEEDGENTDSNEGKD
jgi:uncharacterized Zn finger protein (UPF0148 family)